MVTASLINRLSHAVDLIEQRSKQNRPLKIMKIRCGFDEDGTWRELATSQPIPRIGARTS